MYRNGSDLHKERLVTMVCGGGWGGGGRFVKQNCFSRMSEKNQQLRCLIEQCRKPIKSNSLCYTLKSASLASHEINRLCNFWNLRMKLLKQI